MSHSYCYFVSLEREKTQCERHRESVQAATSSTTSFLSFLHPRPAVGHYVPQCDEHGAYEPTQCHTSIGQCWCVDANGQEIPNTRTGPGNTPLCESTASTKTQCNQICGLTKTNTSVTLLRRYQPGSDPSSSGSDSSARCSPRYPRNTPAVCPERENRTHTSGRVQDEEGGGQTSAAHPSKTNPVLTH